MKLFKLSTITPELHGYRGVHISWIVWSRDMRVKRPYSEMITNYNGNAPDRFYPEGAINELFSGDEAAAWIAWVQEHRGSNVTIRDAVLPIPFNTMAMGDAPLGGENDVLMMWEDPKYSLPFKVGGFYDLRRCERA
jgi:hypothetical protein